MLTIYFLLVLSTHLHRSLNQGFNSVCIAEIGSEGLQHGAIDHWPHLFSCASSFWCSWKAVKGRKLLSTAIGLTGWPNQTWRYPDEQGQNIRIRNETIRKHVSPNLEMRLPMTCRFAKIKRCPCLHEKGRSITRHDADDQEWSGWN